MTAAERIREAALYSLNKQTKDQDLSAWLDWREDKYDVDYLYMMQMEARLHFEKQFAEVNRYFENKIKEEKEVHAKTFLLFVAEALESENA